MAQPPGVLASLEATRELARLANAAVEARADCLRVEVLAQIRIAREYEAAQDAGEVAGHGRSAEESKVRAADLTPATTAELSLDRRRLAEWRELATAGEAACLGAI